MKKLFKASGPTVTKGTGKIIIITLIAALLVDAAACYLLKREWKMEQKAVLFQELGLLKVQMEAQLNASLFIVNGMAVYCSLHPDLSEKSFKSLATILLAKSNILKNIAIAPDYIIRSVYPVKGNSSIIGMDYRKIPEQWPRVKAARETRNMVVAGPLNLIQGGQGLIARVPVFDHATGEFWGIVSSVIDFEKLIDLSGFLEKKAEFKIAIRGKGGKGEKGDVFFGDPNLFLNIEDAITMPIHLPSGNWQMIALPEKGWDEEHQYIRIVHLLIFLIWMAGCCMIVLRGIGKRAIIENEARLKSMSEASLDALIMINKKGLITFWNPAAEKMFGYGSQEVMGEDIHNVIARPDDTEKAKKGLQNFSLTGQGPVLNSSLELKAVHKNGQIFPVELSVAAFNVNGEWFAVGSVRDITERKVQEKKLLELATTDTLTGISNRRHFMEQADLLLKRAIRYKSPISVMMLDLDYFKNVNDTYGHDAGDKVLQTVSQIIKETLRETDLFGRIGGEEFAALFPESSSEAAVKTAERLRQAIKEEIISYDRLEISVTASIGICSFRSDHETLEQLLKKADHALYEAKQQGRNQVCLFRE